MNPDDDLIDLNNSISHSEWNLSLPTRDCLPNAKECEDCGKESLGLLDLKSLSSIDVSDQSNLVSDIGVICPVKNSNELANSSLNVGLSSTSSCDTINLQSFDKQNMNFAPQNSNVLQKARLRIQSLSEPLLVGDNKIYFCSNVGTKQNCSERDLSKYSITAENEDDVLNDCVFVEANYFASKLADGSLILDESCEGDYLLDSTPQPDWNELEVVENAPKCDTESVLKTIDKMLPASQDPLKNDEELNYGCFNSENDCQICKDKHADENSPLCRTSRSFENNEQVEQTLLNLFGNERRDTSKTLSSNNNCRSEDATEMLKSLSTIFKSGHRDARHITEGQNLLYSLANILCLDESVNNSGGNRENLSNDFGHSSTEQQGNNEEIIHRDCRVQKKASTSYKNTTASDLSTKSEVVGNKRLSRSLSNLSPKLHPLNSMDPREHDAFKSCGQNKATSYLSQITGPMKLKPKNNAENVTKRGPLKAVLPVGNMAKQAARNSTPLRSRPTESSLFPVKRSSTPISEPKLIAAAQATPDGYHQYGLDGNRPVCCSPQPMKRKFICPISPLARPSSFSDISDSNEMYKSYQSDSVPNLSNQKLTSSKRDSSMVALKCINRRHSASEVKSVYEQKCSSRKTTNNIAADQKLLRRSYSTGKDITKTIVDHMVLRRSNSAEKDFKTVSNKFGGSFAKDAGEKKSVSAVYERKSLSENKYLPSSRLKPFNLITKLKRSSGKENVVN